MTEKFTENIRQQEWIALNVPLMRIQYLNTKLFNQSLGGMRISRFDNRNIISQQSSNTVLPHMQTSTEEKH